MNTYTVRLKSNTTIDIQGSFLGVKEETIYISKEGDCIAMFPYESVYGVYVK